MKSPETLERKEGADEPWMKNLAACETQMRTQGYAEDFKIDKNHLCTYDGKKTFKATDINIVNFYRFEGVSDPGDNMILYVIETSDGTKGTLVDGYGAYASEDVSKFMAKVPGIEKKIPNGNV